MAVEIPVEAIYRFARRRVRDPELAKDVAQTACLYALTHREARPWQYVFDALDHELRRGAARFERLPWPMERPDWVTSHYATEEQLGERLWDETEQDLEAEWRGLPAAERDRLVGESLDALQTSPQGLIVS